MAQVYRSDVNAERSRLEESWREKRRDAFERFVMMPLSFGMLAAFLGVGLLEMYARIVGNVMPQHATVYLGVASAAAATIDLIVNVVSARPRR